MIEEQRERGRKQKESQDGGGADTFGQISGDNKEVRLTIVKSKGTRGVNISLLPRGQLAPFYSLSLSLSILSLSFLLPLIALLLFSRVHATL